MVIRKNLRYKRPAEDTFNSPRSRRPIQIDEDSASSRSNRLRVSANENERSSPSNSGSNQPSSSQPSILGRSQFLLSNQTPAATIITEVEESANNVGKTSAIPSGDLLSRRVQNRSSMILPEDTPSASSASSKSFTFLTKFLTDHRSTFKIHELCRILSITNLYYKPRAHLDRENTVVSQYAAKKPQKQEEQPPVKAKEKRASIEEETIRLRQKPPLPKQQSSNDSTGSRLSTPASIEQTDTGQRRRSLIIGW